MNETVTYIKVWITHISVFFFTFSWWGLGSFYSLPQTQFIQQPEMQWLSQLIKYWSCNFSLFIFFFLIFAFSSFIYWWLANIENSHLLPTVFAVSVHPTGSITVHKDNISKCLGGDPPWFYSILKPMEPQFLAIICPRFVFYLDLWAISGAHNPFNKHVWLMSCGPHLAHTKQIRPSYDFCAHVTHSGVITVP